MQSVLSLAARRAWSPDYASTVRGRAGELKTDWPPALQMRIPPLAARRPAGAMGIDSLRRSRLVTELAHRMTLRETGSPVLRVACGGVGAM